MKIKEMLKEIVDKTAPFKHDKIAMALAGFQNHADYAKEIINFLEKSEAGKAILEVDL